MRKLPTLLARELRGYVYSPIAYAVGGCFLLAHGVAFGLLIRALADPRMDPSFTLAEYFFGGNFFFWLILLVFTPLVTMRLLSEEQRLGTIELLFTVPVTEWEVVLAKFLSSLLFFILLWTPTALYFLYVHQRIGLDWGPVATGYLGTGLLGALLLSVGLLASSVTRNQIIAAIVAFAANLSLFAIGYSTLFVERPAVRTLVSYCAFVDHFRDFGQGVLDTRPVVYYLSGSVLALFVTVRVIESHRWKS